MCCRWPFWSEDMILVGWFNQFRPLYPYEDLLTRIFDPYRFTVDATKMAALWAWIDID